MSAEEIRSLVRIYSAKEKNIKYELEKFKDAEMTPNLDNISIARNDAIMTIQALLAYAEMVERCEENILFARRIGGMYKHSQSNVLDMLNYILKGKK